MPLVAECVEIAGRVGPRWSAAREACDEILRTLDLEPARADRADLELVPRRQTGIAKDLGRDGDLVLAGELAPVFTFLLET